MHENRRDRVARQRGEHDVDAVLITNLVNVRYLTGFAASNAALIVGDQVTLVTDTRYAEAAAHQCADVHRTLDRDAAGGGVKAAAERGVRRLGFEAANVSVKDFGRLSQIAGAVNVELVALEGIVEPMRSVKDATEIELLRTACEISERAYTRLLDDVHVGVTERWLAARLEFLMCDEGAECAGFPSIVAAGQSSAEPHHVPIDRPLERGDLLKCDFGARVQGYHADITRTVVLGEPAAWQREIYDVVAAAAQAGRAALEPGLDTTVIDQAARSVIVDAGFGEYFGHGIGHGIGLDIHEAPMMGTATAGTLAEGMTVTVEPGIYLPGRGGVRIEDSLVVTTDGSAALTTITRELQVVG